MRNAILEMKKEKLFGDERLPAKLRLLQRNKKQNWS